MVISKMKATILFVSLAAILFFAWAKPIDNFAKKQVDAGFKRAVISFATARGLGAIISVAQGTDVSAQPGGIGVKFAPGQILHPLADLVAKFSDLMLTVTIIFGAMKVLLVIGGNSGVSIAVTVVTVLWLWFYWRGRIPPLWLSRLAIILLLIRFSVPVTMAGSDAVYEMFMADEYKTSQSSLDASTGMLRSQDYTTTNANADSSWLERAKEWVASKLNVKAHIESMKEAVNRMVEHIINIIVVFMLQTIVIPLVFFWALYRVVTAMFQTPVRLENNVL